MIKDKTFMNMIQYTTSAHPRSQTQDELGSLPEVDQSGERLGHHEHKLLELLVVHHIFLLRQLPHGCRQELQGGHQEAKGGEREAGV